MLISIVNHTNGQIPDEDLQLGILAINRQIAHGFEPYWNLHVELRLEGHGGAPPRQTQTA